MLISALILFATLTKLPVDFDGVKHILPFWFTYLYWFLWLCGSALALCLIIFLISRLLLYLQSRPENNLNQQIASGRTFSQADLKRDLKAIFNETTKSGMYRMGLHRVSAVMKTYFEVLLKVEIEEMTAAEIKLNVKNREKLGHFFTGLTVFQYQAHEPGKTEFESEYEKALDLVK